MGHVQVELFQEGEKNGQTIQQVDLGMDYFVLAAGSFNHLAGHGLDNFAGDDDGLKDGQVDVSEYRIEEVGYFWEYDEVFLGSQVAVEQVEKILVEVFGAEDNERLFGLFRHIFFVEKIAEKEEGAGKNIRDEGNVDTWFEDRHKFESQFSSFLLNIRMNFFVINFLRVNFDNFKSAVDHLAQRSGNFRYIVVQEAVELFDHGDDVSDKWCLWF